VLALRRDRGLGRRGGVADHEPETLRVGQRLAQDDVDAADGLRAEQTTVPTARRQQLPIQVLRLEGRQGLERYRTHPPLDMRDRLPVAVPGRRPQPRLHDLEPLLQIVADGLGRPLDEPARVDRRR
jgi:hypothetical protein